MKHWYFIFYFFLFFITIESIEVKNSDLPKNGEWSFSPQKQWETDSAGDDILAEVSEIRMDEKGKLFVLDSRLNKVHVFDPDGKYLFSFGKRGEGPGEIKAAWGLFLINNRVVIPDTSKVHYFSRDGKYVQSIPTPGMFISYLFLDEQRVLAVPFSSLRKEQREVLLYNLKTKDQKLLFRIPKVKALQWSGGGSRLMLRMPFEVAEDLLMVNFSGQVWYGYNDSYKIQQLDFNKKDVNCFSISNRKRETISKTVKLKMFEKVIEIQREIPKNILNKMADQIPDQMPYFHHLFSDKNGLIYVLTATGQHPHRRNVDIFSPQGRYLYRGVINLESDCAIIRLIMNDKNLAAFVEDSEGERKLVKYTIKIPEKK